MTRLHTSRTVALMTTLAAAAGLWASCANTRTLTIPPVRDANGVLVPGGLASMERVELGGVEQTILIRTQDTTQPVLLILHGGPGGALIPWVDLFHTPTLEKNFIVVHWDQRGSGSSYNDDLTVADLQVENFVSDTLELTNMLRTRFAQDQIFLTGISWGSALGFFTLMEDSSPFLAYIPSGERVAWDRSFVLGYEWAVQQARANGDTELLKRLQSISVFDPWNEAHLTIQREALTFYGAGEVHTDGLLEQYMDYALSGQSPYYTAADIQRFPRGIELSNAAIETRELVGNYDLLRQFPTSDIPLHFLVGEFDHNTPADLAFEFYEALDAPAKSFTVIKDAAHTIMWDQPKAWAEALVAIRDRTMSKVGRQASVSTNGRPSGNGSDK